MRHVWPFFFCGFVIVLVVPTSPTGWHSGRQTKGYVGQAVLVLEWLGIGGDANEWDSCDLWDLCDFTRRFAFPEES